MRFGYRRWTDEDFRELARLHAAGWSAIKLAGRFRVSVKAIESAIRRLRAQKDHPNEADKPLP